MYTGAIISEGPMDWQILQQADGVADIELSGSWVGDHGTTNHRVLARVVREDTGESVLPWKAAEMIACESESLGSGCAGLAQGRWHIRLARVPAGGLYRVETCLNINNNNTDGSMRGDMRHHIGIGDLYVITGQSNSAGVGRDPVYDPPEIGVHLLRNCGRWDLASHPLNESTNTLHEVNKEYFNPAHSPYLSFGKYLKNRIAWPVGLVQASLGGSRLSQWNPQESGELYANMMQTIHSCGGKVRGILWYQGCSDTGEAECQTYLKRFGAFVRCVREDLDCPSLPFITVQLNRYVPPSNESADLGWALIREAQRRAARDIPGVYAISSTDSRLSDGIHNSAAANIVLGERLARVALRHIYGQNVIADAPDIVSAEKVTDDTVLLRFDHVVERLFCFDVGVADTPFTLEDESGVAGLTACVYRENTVRLTAARVLGERCRVHGAWEQNPKFTVPVDFETHLPMLSFYGVEAERP